MNLEFNGNLSEKLSLDLELDRLRSSASTRKINRIINNNTSIVKGAGSPIKTKSDFQKVIRVRQSNFNLKMVDNNINSLVDSLNEVTEVANNFTQAKDNLLAIKNIIQDARDGHLDSTDKQKKKKAELNELTRDLNDIAKNARINGKEVFDGNFNVTISAGEKQKVLLDLTYNPDVVYNLKAEKEFRHKIDGFHDGFGNAITNNDKYVVIAADHANTFKVNAEDKNGKRFKGQDFIDSELEHRDGAIEIIDKNTGKRARFAIKNIADKLNYSKDDAEKRFINTQFGSSISLDGDKLVVGASREDKMGDEADEVDTTGSAFILDLDKINFSTNDIDSSGVIELKNSNVDGKSFFGKDVLINDGKAYVSNFNGVGSSISIFDANDGSFIEEIESPTNSESFGHEIEIINDKLIVSGYADDGTVDDTEVGALYIYDKNDLRIAPTILRSPLEAQGYQFGNSLAADDDFIAVGEHKAGQGANITSSGAVHIYNSDGSFIQSLKPTSSRLDSGDKFGSKIAINEKFIAVTAAGDDDKGFNQGSVYIFDKVSGIELAKITKGGAKSFGSSLSLDGDKIYIGAKDNSYIGSAGGMSDIDLIGAGSVFQYDLSDLEIPDLSGPITQATIKISTEDFADVDLTSISEGDSGKAKDILASVDILLAGLETFNGEVHSASKQLESKINTLYSQQEFLREQNSLARKELEKEKANEVRLKENHYHINNKKSSYDLSNSLTTINEAYKYIDANISNSTATKIKTYLNTFIFNKPKTALETLEGISANLTSDLLLGIADL